MKETVTLIRGDKHGDKIEVETKGSLFGFRSGDIITDECVNCCWRNKRVIVEGFLKDPVHDPVYSALWGTVEGEEKSTWTSNASGLIFLERPGWKFKVGDEIVATTMIFYEGMEGEKGRVIVINPYQKVQTFLVGFENFIVSGHNAINLWEEPWYPNCHKTDSKSRLWVAGDNLEFLS